MRIIEPGLLDVFIQQRNYTRLPKFTHGKNKKNHYEREKGVALQSFNFCGFLSQIFL